MGDLVQLDTLRQDHSVPVAPLTAAMNPNEKIRASQDQWLVDQVLEWAEARMATTYRQPLEPKDRIAAMRVLAILRPEPRG
jgi:hypothetical protein